MTRTSITSCFIAASTALPYSLSVLLLESGSFRCNLSFDTQMCQLVNWKGLPFAFEILDLHMEHLLVAIKVDIQNAIGKGRSFTSRCCYLRQLC